VHDESSSAGARLRSAARPRASTSALDAVVAVLPPPALSTITTPPSPARWTSLPSCARPSRTAASVGFSLRQNGALAWAARSAPAKRDLTLCLARRRSGRRRAAECLAAIPVEARIPRPTGLDGLLPGEFGPSSSSAGGVHGSPLPFQTSTPSRPAAQAGGGANPLLASHLRSPDFHRGRPSLSTLSPSEFVPQSPALGLLDGLLPLGGGGSNSGSGPLLTEADVDEADTFDLARSYFDSRELDRCAWTLRSCTGVKAAFLRAYARYLVRLASERRAHVALRRHFRER